MSATTLTLEVVRNFFGTDDPDEAEGAIRSSHSSRLEQFGQEVAKSASADAQQVHGDSYYPGGWSGQFWEWPTTRAESLNLLLYYPSLTLHDPVSDFYFDKWDALNLWKPIPFEGSIPSVIPAIGPPTEARSTWQALSENVGARTNLLAKKVRAVLEIRELLDLGIVNLVSQGPLLYRNRHSLATNLRKSMQDAVLVGQVDRMVTEGHTPLSWDNIRGLDVVPTGARVTTEAIPLFHQHRLYYTAKCLMIAAETGTLYAPDTRPDLDLWRLTVERGARKYTSVQGTMIQAIGESLLSGFKLTPSLAIKLRKNEQAFEEWRDLLTRMSALSQDHGPDQLVDYVQSEIEPIAKKIRSGRTMSGAVLNLDQVPPLAVAIFGIAASSDPSMSVATASAGALSWIYSSIRDRRSGLARVVTTLLRSP